MLFFYYVNFLKVNYKGIQIIVGLITVGILFTWIFCNSRILKKIWDHYFGKDTTEEKKEKKEKLEIKIKATENPNIIFDRDDTQINKSYIKSFSKKRKAACESIKIMFAQRNLSYFILFVLTLLLVLIQIVFAHDIFPLTILEISRNSSHVKWLCKKSAQYYMFEDVIYLPFSLFFLAILYFQLQSRRFNRYIMNKFKKYFDSPSFKEIQNEFKKKEEVIRKEKVSDTLKTLKFQ